MKAYQLLIECKYKGKRNADKPSMQLERPQLYPTHDIALHHLNKDINQLKKNFQILKADVIEKDITEAFVFEGLVTDNGASHTDFQVVLEQLDKTTSIEDLFYNHFNGRKIEITVKVLE